MKTLWNNIDTAPKDGSHILLFRHKICFVGYCCNSGWCINAPGLPIMEPPPTHWMPLPDLPNATHEPLPKWAQRRIDELEERVKRAEAMIPWTSPGIEWFTLFWPGPEPKARAPQKLFTCGDDGTLCVCPPGPEDYVFVGRGKKPNATHEPLPKDGSRIE